MKPKTRACNLFGTSSTLTAILVASFAAPVARAGTIYWDGTTAGWDAVANWSTVAGATTPDPVAVPGIADDAIFNITGVNGAETISLNANQAARSLTFNNTGTTLLQGNTAPSSSRTLTIGSGGILIDAAAGEVTLGSVTALNNVNVSLGANQSWLNNSANVFNVVNNVTGAAGVTQTLEIGGTGNTTFNTTNGTLNAGTGGVLNLTKSGAGILQFGTTSNSTANNLGFGVLNVTGGTVNIGGRDLITGGLTGSGTVGNGSGTTRWMTVNNRVDNLFSGTLENGAAAGLLGIVKAGTGTLSLTGATTYTSRTTISDGTVEYGSASATGSARTVSTAASSGLIFAAGDGAVKSSSDGTGIASLTFGISASRNAGATANYIVNGGTNGTTNSIILTKAAGFIDQGSFFNGADFAVMDGLNTFVRGISYGSDAGAVTSGTTTTLAGTAHQEITGDITAQATATFTTLKNAGNHAITLDTGAIVTTNGILKSGNVAGGATISGGAGIQAASGAEMVIRTDGANDALTISTPILANGASSLTKSGAGTLTLSNTSTYTGTTTVNAGTLTVSGAIGNGALVLRNGTVNVSGATGTGNINIGGGTFNVSGTLGTNTANGNFRVGTVAGAAAVMNILPGAVINNRANLFIGDAGAATGGGAVYQSGGSLTLTQAAGLDNVRIGSNAGGYGYYGMSGGSLTTNELGIGASLAGTVGVMEVSAGTVTNNGWTAVGRGGTTSSGLLNITGGSMSSLRVDINWAATAGASSVINVGGGATAASLSTTGSTTLGLSLASANNAGTIGIANLLTNGTLTTGIVTAGATGTGANPTAHLNFNGGTLKATATNAGANFLSNANVDAVNVYSGGGTIDNSGTAITIGKGLLAPVGSGVSGTSIAVAGGGSGYIGAPLVKLTGGTGSGATGYAVLTGGVVTSVVVTSPGIGYTPGDTLTASFFGGGATTAATDVTGIPVAANTSGGMTFLGSNVTTLSGASTYTGATMVSAGTLLVNGSLADTAVTVQSGATLGGANGVIGSSSASVGVSSGGIFAPGAAGLGAMTVNGGVTINGTYAYEYDGGTLAGDVLDVNGVLTLNNAILNLSDFGGDSYTLNDKFTLAAYDSLGLGSAFAGYADDTYYTFGGGSWLFDYNDATPGSNGGVGTNYITITAIPEPASILLGGLGVLALLRRRRQS